MNLRRGQIKSWEWLLKTTRVKHSPSSHVEIFLFPFYPVAADVRSALLSQVAPVAGVTAFWRASADNAACVHFAVCLSASSADSHHFYLFFPPPPSRSVSYALRKPRSGRERQSDGKRQKKRFLFHFSTRAAPVFHYVRRVEGSQSERLASLMVCDDSSVIRGKRPQLCLR